MAPRTSSNRKTPAVSYRSPVAVGRAILEMQDGVKPPTYREYSNMIKKILKDLRVKQNESDTIEYFAIPVPKLRDEESTVYADSTTLFVAPNGIVLNREVLETIDRDFVAPTDCFFTMGIFRSNPTLGTRPSVFFYNGPTPPYVQHCNFNEFSFRHDGTRLLDWNVELETSYYQLTDAIQKEEAFAGATKWSHFNPAYVAAESSQPILKKFEDSVGDNGAAVLSMYKMHKFALEKSKNARPWHPAIHSAYLKSRSEEPKESSNNVVDLVEKCNTMVSIIEAQLKAKIEAKVAEDFSKGLGPDDEA